MRKRISRALAVAMASCCAAGAIGVGNARAVLFDPLNPAFTSLGALPGGDLTFDTDALTFNGTSGGIVQSQAGGPDVAVFTFDTSTLATGATITGEGSRPLALLFQGTFTVMGTIDVSGQQGNPATPFGAPGTFAGGAGGAGGPGGGTGGIGSGYVTVTNVNFVSVGTNGAGPGGGGRGLSAGNTGGGGGGGGFGSTGRDGGGLGSVAGGGTYGDLIVALEGGSGGGGGGGQCCVGLSYGPGRGGGGGGGGLEIGALGLIDLVGGTILADGGTSGVGGPGFAAGAGSGGGILLHAFDISLDGNSVLRARGGNSTVASGAGCGGGGRIATVTNTAGALTDAGATINVDGGFRCNNQGTVLAAADQSVGLAPVVVAVAEPPSLAIFALGLAGLGLMAWRRRKTLGA